MKCKRLGARLLAVVLSAMIPLSGCANTNGTNSASQTSGTSGSQEKKVELTMIEALASPTRTAALKKIIASFEKENPNYKITLLSPPASSADQKISQMIMAKNKLDIVEVRYFTSQQFIKNNWIQPLDDYISTWKDYSNLSQSAKDSIKIDGKNWGLPIGSYQRMIFYRSDWLKEAGLSIPTGDAWTFDALYNLAKKMTDPSKGRYGWTLRGSGNAYQQFIQMVMLSAAGSKNILSINEPYFTKDKKSIYRTDYAKKGFEAQLKFYKDCSPADSIAWKFSDQINAFTSGITAFLMQDCDSIGAIKSKMKDGTWATAPMPVDSVSKQGNMFLGMDFWGMTSYTPDKAAAWKFLSYLDNAQNSSYFCKEYGLLPPYTNASELEPTFKSATYAPYTYMFSKPDTYFSCGDGAMAYSSHTDEFGQISDTDIQNVLSGKANMDDVLQKWAGLWEKWRAASDLD